MSSNDADADDNKDYNNSLGYDNPTGGGSSSDKESSSYNDKSPPERWILVIAMAILAFGIILLTLRSVIFSLIFVTIGISLFAYWLYVGAKEQNRILTTMSGVNKRERGCTCPICKHTESNACLETRCPCCILTRNKQIIGHFNNPLQ